MNKSPQYNQERRSQVEEIFIQQNIKSGYYTASISENK